MFLKVYLFSKISSNEDELIVPSRLGFEFLGWYDETGKKYESMSDVVEDVKLVAKWEALTPVTDIVVEGVESEMVDGDTFQIKASVLPNDAFFQQIEFATSNRDIFTVSNTGLVTAINPGTATLTITAKKEDFEDAFDKFLEDDADNFVKAFDSLNADNIIVLSHGEILESGNHQELLKKKGHYYNLYNKILYQIT